MRPPSRAWTVVALSAALVVALPVRARAGVGHGSPEAEATTDESTAEVGGGLEAQVQPDPQPESAPTERGAEPPAAAAEPTSEPATGPMIEPPVESELRESAPPPLLPVPEVEPEPEPAPAVVEAPVYDGFVRVRDSPEARRARRWLGAGIGATVTGAALVGGALAMGLTDACTPGTGNNCFEDARDRAALTMGVPGGVLLLGGAAMITYAGLERRKLWFGVGVSGERAGLTIRGRF